MITYTPKVGRLIALEVLCSDKEAAAFGDRAMSELKERGAAQVFQYIIADCTTTERKETMAATVFNIRAIVMSEDEFKESVNRAYMDGLRDGRSR